MSCYIYFLLSTIIWWNQNPNVKSSDFFIAIKDKMKIYILSLLACTSLLQAEGFIADTLISVQHKLVPIECLVPGKMVDYESYVTHVMTDVVDSYIKICIKGCVVCTTLDQKFYVYNTQKWTKSRDLLPFDLLLCRNGSTVQVDGVEIVYKRQDMYMISVNPSHIFYITSYEIIAHNIEPVGGAAVAFLSVFCPPAGAALAALETVALGVAGIGTYWAYKKHQKRKKLAESLVEKNGSSNCGGGKDPREEDDEKKYPHGIYEESPYHHRNSKKRKSRSPKNGQRALDNSFEIEGVGRHRIALDGDEFVVLMFTSVRRFHGHVRTWEMLERPMQKTLENQGLVSSCGKIIKKVISL